MFTKFLVFLLSKQMTKHPELVLRRSIDEHGDVKYSIFKLNELE